MKISELKAIGPWTLVRRVAEASLLAAVFAGIVSITGISIYRCATSNPSNRRTFSGKIVEKKIRLLETDEGSLFIPRLVIEEKNGTRFQISVPQELYDRAQVGMLIQRSTKGIELLPNPHKTSISP